MEKKYKKEPISKNKPTPVQQSELGVILSVGLPIRQLVRGVL